MTAYTKQPGEHADVAKLTGLPVSTCRNYWDNGDRKLGLAPIREVIEAAGQLATVTATAAVNAEICADAVALVGAQTRSAQELAATREAVDNSVEIALGAIRATFARALKDEQTLIQAGRNAVTGIYSLSMRTLAALQTTLERTIEQIANAPIESPQEALGIIERVTEIIHKAGIAAQNLAAMERQLQTAAGWQTPTGGQGQGGSGGQEKPLTNASVVESLRTIQRAAELVAPLARSKEGAVQDVPYQEEQG